MELLLTMTLICTFRDSMLANETIEDNDRKFIQHFLKNGTIKDPTESMFLPTDSLTELTEQIEKNKTNCFKIDPGMAGWCATCKVRADDRLCI